MDFFEHHKRAGLGQNPLVGSRGKAPFGNLGVWGRSPYLRSWRHFRFKDIFLCKIRQ